MALAVIAQRQAGQERGYGLQLEFVSEPGFELAFESLARGPQKIELLNVRYDAATQTNFATVFVPDGKLSAFESLVNQYLQSNSKKGIPRNTLVLNPIHEIRIATFDALWTDDPAMLPASDDEAIWWEFWLPVREDQSAVIQRFKAVAEVLKFQTSEHLLTFPERTVLNVYGTKAAIMASMVLLNEVAEIRRAKETAEFFDALPPFEQADWAQELAGRVTAVEDNKLRVCLLDTGINPGHPLLSAHIEIDDLHSVDAAWGVHDTVGHGTGLAGIALYGDLVEPLLSGSPVSISHRVESVKLLQAAHASPSEPYGSLTMRAVAYPEIKGPDKQRIFSMAITSIDDRDRGRPSAWSAAVDMLTADYLGERANPRLMIVCAGNANAADYLKYPHSNLADGIHDPGQSWNAICVGAYTLKDRLDPPRASSHPLAAHGGLSPYSTTSRTWTKTPWPLKPDVVFEGGNLVRDVHGAFGDTSLSLLTTSHTPAARMFSTTWATSAASALAARMAAQISAAYPDLWPETVRALMVHSAEWTPQMTADFLAGNSKSDYEGLVRACGFGVPDLGRAIWSAANSLTLVVEDKLRPFGRQGTKPATAKDMNLHNLPWPKQSLLDLGDAEVEMRVTLSYFIEPNPGVIERGVSGRYRYESHGLRFEVSRESEDVTAFRQRINKKARAEEDGLPYVGSASDDRWCIGVRGRHRGSLHSDIWRGPASALAGLGLLGVYPAPGWWKTLVKKNRYNEDVRYSLVVSIKSQQTEIDLYNAVSTEIANRNVIVT
ncbi:S8 family peptidase [Pseudomonas fulva]|nr:S8 family peptidase [Pseudomonas fulva]